MLRNDLSRLEQIFTGAVGLAPDERRRFVRTACGDDAQLERRVHELLADSDSDDTLSFDPIVVTEGVEALVEGREIGPYRLERRIGDGGFGVVYAAHQERPVRRKVAIKILKLAAATDAAILRFSMESQVLAGLRHPSIAKVHDAGTTDHGEPYFVMELVEHAEPITRFCDRRRLDLDTRLALFENVCDAVRHAHLNMVIHRDLKPSNVLATMIDGRPVVKVIDFGIAKVMGDAIPAHVRAMPTATASVMGSLAYMSPEQAAGASATVDARSDVYSLGALLYELLTGRGPFTDDELRTDGTRVIREVDPPAPSRVASVEVRPALRGDLDAIIRRALAKDPAQRYQSVGALVEDLRSHREDRPISAMPGASWPATKKFVRRQRWSLCFAGVLLIAGAFAAKSFVVGQALEAREAIITAMMNAADVITSAKGNEKELETLALRAIGQAGGDDLLAAEILYVYALTGKNIESPGTAMFFQRALDHAEAAVGPDAPQSIAIRLDLELYRDEKGEEGARHALRELVVRARDLLGANEPVRNRALASFAGVLMNAGDYEAAVELYEEAVQSASNDPESMRVRYDAGLQNARLHVAHRLMTSDADGAAAMFEELIPPLVEIAVRQGELIGDDSVVRSDTLHAIGSAAAKLERWDLSDEAYDAASAIRASKLGRHSAKYMTTRCNLGKSLKDRGLRDDAIEVLESLIVDAGQAVEILEAQAADAGSDAWRKSKELRRIKRVGARATELLDEARALPA